jgi:hypothetical protein
MRVRVKKIRILKIIETLGKIGKFRNIGETEKGVGRTGKILEGLR